MSGNQDEMSLSKFPFVKRLVQPGGRLVDVEVFVGILVEEEVELVLDLLEEVELLVELALVEVISVKEVDLGSANYAISRIDTYQFRISIVLY